MWATGQDTSLAEWEPRGMAGWRARERLWFISASGAHLASMIQGLRDQGKVRDCRRPAWELGIGSNSEKRGESSSCWGWYLYNDSVWGRKRNRFCWDTFLPPLCCPWVAPKGWHGESLSGLCPSMCRDMPGFSLISGMSEPRSCLLVAEGSPLLGFSASAVPSLLLVSLSDGVSPTVPPQL